MGEWRNLILICLAITAFCIGMGNTVKSGINSELATHSCVEVATFVSFLGALILLEISGLSHYICSGPREIPTWREGLTSAWNSNRWELIGGFLGFISLSLQTFAIYYLGASLMKVLLCTTEVTTSVILDTTGHLQPGPGIKLSMITAGAVFFSLMGAAIIMYEDWYSPRLNESAEIKAFACICPLIAGSLRPVQSRINFALSKTFGGSKFRATEWSFITGTTFLFIGSIVNVAVDTDSLTLLSEVTASDWWMFFGGPFSVATVYGAIALPPFITLGSHFICMTSGQLSMALYLDSIGAFTFEQKTATTPRILGTLLTITGAVLSRLPYIKTPSNKPLEHIKINSFESI